MSTRFPEYPKINSVFKRHPSTNKFIMDQWSMPEFGLLADVDWLWSEKVDGTNIRIMVEGEPDNLTVSIGGRTDSAQIPSKLAAYLVATFRSDEMMECYAKTFDFSRDKRIILYGEGYGGKIQKGGNYRPDESFILFDGAVKFGDDGHRHWFHKSDLRGIAETLQLDMVPFFQPTSLQNVIEIVANGFPSQLNASVPEGVVGTPAVPLLTEKGDRIICKVKTVDFIGVL